MSRSLRVVAVAVALGALTGSGAWAADLPMKMPAKAAPAEIPYNWTGFYVGGHIGGGWVDGSSKYLSTTGVALDPAGTVYGTDHSGFLGGAQLGYNYQIQNWVLGLGGDFSWTDASTETASSGSLVAGSKIYTQVKTDWYASLTGRVGYALNNWLIYAKGGAAWVHQVYGGYATAGGTTITSTDISDTRNGWTVGGGVEWGFWGNWSAFVEYDYLDFGTKNYTFSNSNGTTTNNDIFTAVNMVKGGVNYRF